MKKILCVQVLIVIAVLFSGCGFNFTKPERFGIKTSDEAVYRLAIADKSFPIGEFFSIDSFLQTGNEGEESGNEESEGDGLKYKIYSYAPANDNNNNTDIQQFLLKMDLEKIPLGDFSSALKGTEIKASFNNSEGKSDLDFSKKITVPDVNRRESKAVNLALNDKVNALVTITGQTGPKSDVAVLFSDENNNFDSITYQSGFMVIKPNDALTEETITGSIILKKGTTELQRADFSQGEAKLPLDGIKIEKQGLSFEFTASQGVPFIAYVESDSVVKSAEGLTVQQAIPISAHQEISIGSVSGSSNSESSLGLETYTIGSGSLSLLFNLPSGWNDSVEYDYTMTLSDALNATITKNESTCPLDNETFYEDSKLVADVTGNFHLTNATLVFIDDQGKSVNPEITVDISVSKIKTAVLKLNTAIQFPTAQTQTLPESVTKNVKSILWDEYGFSISYVNTFPAENKFTVNSSSEFFQLEQLEEPVVLEPTAPAVGDAAPVPTVLNTFVNKTTAAKEYKTFIGTGPGELTSVDIDAAVNITGYNSEQNTLTVRELEPGKTYEISIEVTPILEWNKIWIDTSTRNKNDTVSTGLNLSSVFSSLESSVGADIASKLKFARVPIYLFAETPTLPNGNDNQELKAFFDGIAFNGLIKAYIGNDDCTPVSTIEGNEIYLLGEKENDVEVKKDLHFEQGLNLAVNENNEITTNIRDDIGSEGKDLAPILNSREEGSLCVSYDIGLQTGNTTGQLAITQTQLEQLKSAGSASIAFSVLCIIPLEFDVENTISMNLLKLIGKEENEESSDLLGRTEDPDYSQIKEFAKAIQDVTIIYEPSSLPFNVMPAGTEDDMSLLIDLDGDGEKSSPKKLSISGDSIAVTPEEILQYPLCPSLELEIPKGTLCIPKNPSFNTKINIEIRTSGEVIWLDSIKSKKEGGNE